MLAEEIDINARSWKDDDLIDWSRHGVAQLRCEVVRSDVISLGNRVLRLVLGKVFSLGAL